METAIKVVLTKRFKVWGILAPEHILTLQGLDSTLYFIFILYL